MSRGRPVIARLRSGVGGPGTSLRSQTVNEPALVTLIELWSNLRAMKGGSRMMENSPVG